MSPTVPPISVMMMSYLPVLPSSSMRRLISSVMCGTICTVLPRYAPSRSLVITVLYILPVVTLLALEVWTPRKRS